MTMKYIIAINRHVVHRIGSLLLGSAMLLGSCTDNFEKINTNPVNIPEVTPTVLPFLFTKALSTAPNNSNNYQIAQNLFADQYAQYFACTTASFGSDRLVINQNWVGAAFNPQYTEVAPQLQQIFMAYDPSSAEYALANIWWVYAFHRVTDYWGPIPYFKVLQDIPEGIPYDPQNLIYDDFFKRLDDATKVLAGKTDEEPFGIYDIMYGGDVPKWIKFANTLRLRLALRISNVDEDRAQSEAEAAVAGGVMEASPADDALVQKNVAGDPNGLSIMQWNEFRMSASMESVLKGYEDPRMEEYYLPTAGGEYEGIRNGLTPAQLGLPANHPSLYSQQGPRWSPENVGGTSSYQSTSQNVMCAAEAWFLRAEGELKNWNMGTGDAETFYANGITQSFKQWGIADDPTGYINSTNEPIAPGDQLNSPAMTDIPVKFSADPAIAAEQIATQKWIALFPDGVEAWADYRRSKLVKLYPVANSDNALITNPEQQWLRRIPFLTSEKQINSKMVEQATTLLNGPDDTQTPLWWDTHPRN
jgi:hypothetical protein